MSKLDKFGYLVAAAEHFGRLGVSLSVAGTAHGIGRDVWTTFRRGCSHADRGSVAVSAVIMWRHVGVGTADTRRATGPVLWRTNVPRLDPFGSGGCPRFLNLPTLDH